MNTLEFSIVGLEADPQGSARIHLRDTAHAHDLRVRVGAVDGQALAAELAGLRSARSRLVFTIGRMAQSLNAQLTQIQLERSTGNVVEAQLILTTDLDQTAVPLSFSDAIALAHTLHLPIVGDASLAPLLQSSAAPEPVYHIPSTIEAFLNSLSDA